MTKKQASSDWADHISSSDLPADELTFTDGSNYGLDGYQFSETMNEGVMSQARLPSVAGLSKLPDGIVGEPDGSGIPGDKLTEDKWGFDLSSMLSEEEGALHLPEEVRKVAGVTDLSWLDPTQKQDPSRLPKGLHPTVRNQNSVIQELVDAWGAGEATTGLDLVPNTSDREIEEYVEEIDRGPRSGLPGNKRASSEEVRDVVLRAMRRSTFGHPMSEIKREAAESLGASAPRAKRAMAQIEAEHGLAGNVFIRASAFPGLKNGKWVKELRRVARNARYVLTDDPAVADKLKMEAVSEVPWKAALKHYRPLLTALGHKVASKGNPQGILRAAFLGGPGEEAVRETSKPIDVRPADRVSSEEARQVLSKTPIEERRVVDLTEKRAKSQRRKALVRIAKWVRAGLLDRDDALKLHTSSASPAVLLKTGAQLIVASGRSDYEGSGTLSIPNVPKVSRKAAWAALRSAESETDKEQEALEAHRAKQFQRHVAKMVRAGLATEEEAKKLLAMGGSLAEKYKMASAVAAHREKSTGFEVENPSATVYKGTVYKTAALRRKAARDFSDEDKRVMRLAKKAGIHSDDIPQVLRWAKRAKTPVTKAQIVERFAPKATEKKAYEGVIFEQATASRREVQDFSPEEKRIQATAKKANIPVGNLKRVLRFTRQQMSEGLVGDDLDAMLQAKFAGPVRKAAQDSLKALRAAHEGLAGHLYVDATAYLSKTGTSGCDEGALKHRTNGLKYVLAADRCGDCLHAAHGRCKLYRKTLVMEAPVEDPRSYQRKVLAAAKASDGENTASLFNPSEFDLNSPLDDFEMKEAASVESLGEILFGGMEA